MTFGALRCVRSEPLRILAIAASTIYQVAEKNYVAALHIYVLGPKYCDRILLKSLISIQISSRKLFRQFMDSLQFSTKILQKLWHHLATKIRKWVPSSASERAVPSKWVSEWVGFNVPINTLNRQCAGRREQTNRQKHTNTIFSYLQPAACCSIST